MDKKRLLIIDDTDSFCNLVKMNLELDGEFAVDVATRGKKGIELAEKLKPDLIILDIIMPDMDGISVLKVLREHMGTSDIPVIMLTASEDEVFKAKAADFENNAYLTKPVSAEALKSKIKEILGM